MLTGEIEPFSENDYNFAGRPPLRLDLLLTYQDLEIPILWFWPNFNEMPESLRALLGRETDNFLNRKDRNVWNESWPHELTEELLMKYNGNMKPLERSRYPSNELK